jgi:hypothetical protein
MRIPVVIVVQIGQTDYTKDVSLSGQAVTFGVWTCCAFFQGPPFQFVHVEVELCL